jgi:hypothetical protein
MEQWSHMRLRRLRLMLPLNFNSDRSYSSRLRSQLGKQWLRVHLAFGLLLLSCFAVAQDDGSNLANSSTRQKFNVSGTVVNEGTGEPIARAMITLMGSPPRYAFTDGNGSFTLEGVPAGRYPVQAQKPGFFGPQERGGSRSVQSVEVSATSDSVVIKLAAENVIFGRLTQANGQPIESLSVRLVQRVLRNGAWRMESRSAANTDDDGSYRFANLQPGTYYVSAGPDISQRATLFDEQGGLRTGWPGMYYPQAPDLASAAPIRVASGQKVQADMVMNPAPVYTVSGVVVGFVPGQSVTLQVQNSSGDYVGAGVRFNPASGQFETHLPPGNYRLKAYSQLREQQLRSEVRFTVERDLTQLQLALQPAVSIPVHVRLDDRAQSSAQSTRSRAFGGGRGADDLPPVSVHLLSTEPGVPDGYSTNGGLQGSRTLSLRSIEPGRYSAELFPYGGWYVESAQCGNANLLTEELIVTAGTTCTLELTLRNDGGTLDASVEGAKSPGPGMALLIPVRGRSSPRPLHFYVNEAAQPAHIQADSLAPGDYLLFAFDAPEGVEYSNPDVLRSYTSQATPVTISAGQAAKVTVQLIQTGSGTE